jgi:malate dehydrogenase
MERKDLLGINGKIFIGQGEAIARNAKKSVKVLVVGNPCNTNALIALRSAGNLPVENFFAMTRLDENRAKSQLAGKAGAHNSVVKNVAIWGNHSATQFPDFANTTVDAKSVPSVITDGAWLQGEFITTVQKRGAAIIEARGLSSAASAANAAIDTVVSLTTPTAADDCVSVAVTSNGEYGVPEGLTFGFPIQADGKGAWKVKEGFNLDDFAKDRIKITTDELLGERDDVKKLGLI